MGIKRQNTVIGTPPKACLMVLTEDTEFRIQNASRPGNVRLNWSICADYSSLYGNYEHRVSRICIFMINLRFDLTFGVEISIIVNKIYRIAEDRRQKTEEKRGDQDIRKPGFEYRRSRICGNQCQSVSKNIKIMLKKVKNCLSTSKTV
jgi:hypothetical protein